MADFPWLIVALYLTGINLLTLVLFALDKHRARRGRWRLSEQSLLLFCLLGGTPGAYWARKKLRHKTRKQPFSTRLHMIVVMQAFAGLAGVWIILSGKDL